MSEPVKFPKKRLGQHFLIDPNTARIVADGVSDEDVVLEIGPGRGFLTRVLAERAAFVHALELDGDVLAALRHATRDFDNVSVRVADALDFDYESLSPPPNRMVANLPYNIASPLVLRLLEGVPNLKSLRFMVQLEVARRMAARRGMKDYAGFAVLVQLLSEPEVVHRVSPTVFRPPPRVYSAIVEMKRRETTLPPEEYESVKRLVLSAFSSRRKRLVNNLDGDLKEEAEAALVSLDLGRDARAEELAPEDFVALNRGIS